MNCPNCGSTNIFHLDLGVYDFFVCNDCNCQFTPIEQLEGEEIK